MVDNEFEIGLPNCLSVGAWHAMPLLSLLISPEMKIEDSKRFNLMKLIFLTLLFSFLLSITCHATEKIYSIQTGSFINPENANKQVDSLSQKLHLSELDHLRIEKANKFYMVRVGQFEDKEEANKFLKSIKPLFPEAIIVEVRSIQPPIKVFPSIDPETILARAKELANEGKYREALFLLSTFTSEPMEYPTVFSDYLVILVWDGRHDEAIGMYEKLPHTFPRKAYLLRNLGKAYYEKKEFLKAFSLYKAALKETPLDEEAQKGLLLSLVQTGNYSIALDYLENFLEKTPDSLSLILTKAYLLLMQDKYLEAIKVYRMLAERKDVESKHVYKIRDDLLVSLPDEKQKTMLSELHIASQEDRSSKLDYILVLILNKDYNTAIKVFETSDLTIDYYTNNLLCWIAWAYFKTGNIEKAKFYYQNVLNTRPDHMRANIGLAYCLSVEGEANRSIEILDKLLLAEPNNLEIRFARAFVYEKSRRFWDAVHEYDRILEVSPQNPVAIKLKLQALSDLGASSLALEGSSRDLSVDLKFQDSLKADMAVDRINWKEPSVAISILMPLLQNRENMRARYDHIIALAENDDMEEVVKAYEKLIEERISPPPWVLENVAEAYLYLEQPDKALELYNKALEINPVSSNGRMGKFYTLQELRKWKEAREELDSLDREQPDVMGEGKYIRPNWPKMEIIIARPWLLAYEERLKDAEDLFWNLRERAPASMGVRTGLSHVYLWRGWPRKALREFNIIETLEPENHKALIGKSMALNALAFKDEARKLGGKLLSNHHKDKHVQQLVRILKVEEMRELFTDFVFTRDEDGFKEYRAEIIFSQPVSLYTNLYGLLLWQQSSDDDQTRFFRRAGLGITHIFNSSWDLRQQFSIDYDKGDDFGSLTQVNFSPDDHWRFNLSYDSFTTDVPLRARIFGIESDKLEGGIIYRESDWRNYHLTLSRMKFSDGNRREYVMLGYEQSLFVKNDWKMRLFLDLYASRNSLQDAPYFNPDHDLSLSATHMTEQILWRIYNRAFVQKLFLTLGTYKQSGFADHLIWSIKYQHDYDFSDTHAFLWGLTIARNVYDGEPVHSYAFYLTYRWRF